MIDQAAALTALSPLYEPLLHSVALHITALGSVSITLIVAILLYYSGNKQTCATLLLTVILSGGVTILLKYGLGVPRPGTGSIPVMTPSFPSGHTALAFSTAVVLADRFTSLRYIFFLLATIVGLTRVLLGVHYTLDIIVGAIIGTAAGIGILYLRKENYITSP